MNDYLMLAAALLGRHPNDVEDDEWDQISEDFQVRYNFDITEVEDLLNDLLKFIIPQVNSLSGEAYQFFGIEDPNKPGIWTALLRRKYQRPAPATGD